MVAPNLKILRPLFRLFYSVIRTVLHGTGRTKVIVTIRTGPGQPFIKDQVKALRTNTESVTFIDLEQGLQPYRVPGVSRFI
jgi:hypothetical protein